MKRRNVLAMIVILALAFAAFGTSLGNVLAASGNQANPTQTPVAPNNSGTSNANNQSNNQQNTPVLSNPTYASNLMGFNVVNTNGQNVGDISGMIVNSQTGNVLYLLLNGTNLINNNTYVVPWGAFGMVANNQLNNNNNGALDLTNNGIAALNPGNEGLTSNDATLVLRTNANIFNNAPTINQVWGNNLGSGWDTSLLTFWNNQPNVVNLPGRNAQGTPIRISNPGVFNGLDLNVVDNNGNNLGSITDFVINPGGTVRWALLQTGSFLGLGGKTILVPFKALNWNNSNNNFVLNANQNFLQNAPGVNNVNSLNIFNDNYYAPYAPYWVGFNSLTQNDLGVFGQNNSNVNVTNLNVPLFASTIMDYAVYGQNGNRLGSVTGLEIDPTTGYVRYVLVELDNYLQGGLVPVPYEAFNLVRSSTLGVNNNSAATVPNTANPTAIAPGFSNATPVAPNGALNNNGNLTNNFGKTLALQLNIQEGTLTNAPTISEVGLANVCIVCTNRPITWNNNVENYWRNQGNNLFANGEAQTPSAQPLVVYHSIFTGIDINAMNTNSADIGEIHNFIIQPNGNISYAILQTDSAIGINGNLVPVPYGAMNWNASKRTFVINVSNSNLAKAPNFAGLSDFPVIYNNGWDNNLTTFWGQYTDNNGNNAGVPNTGGNANFPSNTDQVMGSPVVDQQGNQIGRIAGLVTGANDNINYGIVRDFSQNQYIAIPWVALNWNANNQQVVYTKNTSLLNNAPAIQNPGSFNPNAPGWDNSARNYWSNYTNLTP